MTYTVNEINIFTNKVLDTHEFGTAADAMEYALTMNELMEATPIRYKVNTQPVEIELIDRVPGMTIEPVEVPAPVIPEDFDI